MAEEGKGLSPAGHHRVRLPGKERHLAAAGDGSRSGGLGGGGEDGGRDMYSRGVGAMKSDYFCLDIEN